MTILAQIDIDNNDGSLLISLFKKYDSNLVPTKGIEFIDSAFKEGKEIINVEIEPERNIYHVHLGRHKCDVSLYRGEAKENREEIEKFYAGYGWVKPGEL